MITDIGIPRLVVALDLPPDEGGVSSLRRRTLELASALKGLSIIIKVHIVLRACGYGLIDDLHALGHLVFADLKLKDIPTTIRADAEAISYYKPEFVSVHCSSHTMGLRKAQDILAGVSRVIGITVTSDFNEIDARNLYHRSLRETVLFLAEKGIEAGLNHFVMPVEYANEFKQLIHPNRCIIFSAGLRPNWWGLHPTKEQDDQARLYEAYKMLEAGSDSLICGRPILRAGEVILGPESPKDPKSAVLCILEDIQRLT